MLLQEEQTWGTGNVFLLHTYTYVWITLQNSFKVGEVPPKHGIYNKSSIYTISTYMHIIE